MHLIEETTAEGETKWKANCFFWKTTAAVDDRQCNNLSAASAAVELLVLFIHADLQLPAIYNVIRTSCTALMRPTLAPTERARRPWPPPYM